MRSDLLKLLILFYLNQECVSLADIEVDGPMGKRISLNCELTYPAPVSWERSPLEGSNFSDLPFNDSKYEGRQSRTLTINQLTFQDDGKYRCRANNVNVQPFYGLHNTLHVYSTIEVTVGRNATFMCSVKSNNYRWEKFDYGMKKYNYVTNTIRFSGVNDRQMTIGNTQSSDAGKYQCALFLSNSKTSHGSARPILLAVGGNGFWGLWTSWSICSSTCDVGISTRTRHCNNTAPSGDGSNCIGNPLETEECLSRNCSIDGGLAPWSEWSNCTISCEGGNRTRFRKCINPAPAHGGMECDGNKSELKNCLSWDCTVPEPRPSVIGPAAGGAAVAIIIVLVVIVIIILRKRNMKSLERTVVSSGSRKQEETKNNSHCVPDLGNKNNTYLNIGRTSRSCTETDEDLQLSEHAGQVNQNIDYCNVSLEESLVLTNIHIDELRDYIKRRVINDCLTKEYKALSYGSQYPTTIATAKENMPKNRFKIIFPYDHTRVVLQNGPDYINANHIEGFEKEECYIASQGPTQITMVDHWRMIWQLNIRRIVMLTNLIEGSKRKCEQYWPEGETQTTHGILVLTLLSEKARAAYVTRHISVEDKVTNEKRIIIQYHFTSWPDHGTPDPVHLVLFHRHVMSEQSASNTGPLLVHCSAGIGRSGTYIALDSLYEQGKTTGYIDVPVFVKKMRYCRMNMVQTPEQYVCLHQALLEAFTMKDTNIEKKEFGIIWRNIVTDKRPTNHQRLREEFKILEEKKQEHTHREHVFATRHENVDKNRNPLVLPADKDRVYLSSFEKGRTDYINAVRLPSYSKLYGYVSTQLPLPDTKVDFWTMIRDQESSIIVVFLKEHKEADLVYSLTKSNESLGLNALQISNAVDEEGGIKTVSLTLNKKDTTQRDIIMYQVEYDGLPEAAVLCKLTNQMSTRINMTKGPVTVVSSDGASISGLFCTFSNAVSSMTIDENADIFQLARLLQLKRPEFFKDFEEYRKVYEAVNYYLESTNVYANF